MYELHFFFYILSGISQRILGLFACLINFFFFFLLCYIDRYGFNFSSYVNATSQTPKLPSMHATSKKTALLSWSPLGIKRKILLGQHLMYGITLSKWKIVIPMTLDVNAYIVVWNMLAVLKCVALVHWGIIWIINVRNTHIG